MADPLKERISLLTIGEAQGKLKPEHRAELNKYRQQGLAKSTPAPSPAPPNSRPAPAASSSALVPSTLPRGQAAQAAYTKVAAARQMRRQLERVESLYNRDMGASGLAGLKEFNPLSQKNQRFDGAVAAIPLLARQAFRVSGSGADSDRELKLISDALPNRKSFDATNAERFSTLDNVLGGFIDTYGGLAGYSPEQIATMQAQSRRKPKPPAAPPRAAGARPNAAALRAKYGLR